MTTVKTAASVATAAATATLLSYLLLRQLSLEILPWRRAQKKRPRRTGLLTTIGNTPLIRINSLSDATGCEILGKAEFLNPGGSVKDRVAVQIIEEVRSHTGRLSWTMLDVVGRVPSILSIVEGVGLRQVQCHARVAGGMALESGELVRGGVVTEGSAGSTAISLAMVAPAYGCKCHVVIPDDAAIEKSQILEALGATVERVRPVSITHRDHFVNVAKRRAAEAAKSVEPHHDTGNSESSDSIHTNGFVSKPEKCHPIFTKGKAGYFSDQFENLANFRAHYESTGPEIWEQTGGKLHGFIAAAGTGGTLAGISCFLKEKDPKIKCFLIDPPGSGLFNKVTRGVMYTKEEAEGRRLKNPFDTITEGIGINRLTKNFMMAKLDGAYRGTDKEAVEMSRFLLRSDGLFVGSSSAMNCVGAVRLAQALGPGHTIVTILCDNGMRHLSKFYNPRYLADLGLTPSATGLEFLDHP